MMEDIQPNSAAEQESFCVELMKRLNIQRKQDYLCDITLVTNDDREFKAHRNVLSAASPFFCKLLESDMKENREGIVRFEEISGTVMEDVLEFIYTGTVEVTQENAKELIAAGNYLMIPSLKTVSGRFLEAEMSNSNCISTFYFAEKYDCDELMNNSRRFVLENFRFVAALDEFLNLEAKEVEKWLSSDDISVETEADVFKIVLEWIEHGKSERKAFFEQLFRHVRLVLMSRDYLIDVVTNELVQESFACLRLTSAALKGSSFSSEGDVLQTPRKGVELQSIVVCAGFENFCYFPEKDQWKRLPGGKSTGHTQMTRYREKLFRFPRGGSVERYDPVFNVWSELELRENVSRVAIVRGEMYALELNTSEQQTTVKIYNVEQCTWETLHSSSEACREQTCVVSSGTYLYVFGGKPPETREYVAKAERFDTVIKKWEEIADMLEERGDAFGEATKDKIFVAGGKHREGNSVLQTCEIYNILTNEWQLTGSLNVSRMRGSMMCLKGKLYVLGGEREENYRELKVECFNSEEGKWIHKTKIPSCSSWYDNWGIFNGCVLKLSKGVLDKLSVV